MNIELKDVTVSYPEKVILQKFSGKFEFGKLNVLIGKNGIGKSTLLDVISGLKLPEFGSIKGTPVSKKIMYMFQSTPFNTNITVKQLLNMYSLFSKQSTFEYYHLDEIQELYIDNLKPLLHSYLGDLSGGEIKLVFSYASIMVPKSLYLFDEPLSGVDIENRIKIVKLLEKLGKKVPVIMTSHELSPFENIDCTLKYICKSKFLFSGSYQQLVDQYGEDTKIAFMFLTQEMRRLNEK